MAFPLDATKVLALCRMGLLVCAVHVVFLTVILRSLWVPLCAAHFPRLLVRIFTRTRCAPLHYVFYSEPNVRYNQTQHEFSTCAAAQRLTGSRGTPRELECLTSAKTKPSPRVFLCFPEVVKVHCSVHAPISGHIRWIRPVGLGDLPRTLPHLAQALFGTLLPTSLPDGGTLMLPWIQLVQTSDPISPKKGPNLPRPALVRG